MLVKAEGENLILVEAKSRVVIPNEKNIRGNITLPTEIVVDGNKVNITWESSNPNVITDEATGESGEIPLGVVKRQSTDQNVKLTAVFQFNGEVSEKVFDIVVIKAIQQEDFKGYIYTYFRANCSIIIQLLQMDVVPKFTEWSKQGDVGRRKLAQQNILAVQQNNCILHSVVVRKPFVQS
ncbi:hypothetical protein QFZ72_002312 [Bacillus sp. V2I10]|nr:hypothetical protein [Bacillus sp. V2I10]